MSSLSPGVPRHPAVILSVPGHPRSSANVLSGGCPPKTWVFASLWPGAWGAAGRGWGPHLGGR